MSKNVILWLQRKKVAQRGCYFAGRIIGYCQVFEVGIVYGCGIITVFTYSIRRVFNMRIIEMNKHDGFEILRKIDLNNISNERQGKIERLTGKNL